LPWTAVLYEGKMRQYKLSHCFRDTLCSFISAL